MILKKKSVYLGIAIFIVCLLFILPLSILVGSRELGTDTIHYEYSFYLFKNYSYISNEPGIYLLAWLSLLLGGDVQVYFWFVFIVSFIFMNLAFYKFFYKMFEPREICLLYFVFIGSYLFSTWFQIVSLSVIRQGLALFVLYFAIACYVKQDYKQALVFIIIAILTHKSVLLLVPFLILLRLHDKKFYSLFFISALLYPLGVTEYVVMTLSSLTGIPVYSLISSYSEDNVRYFGFNYLYFIYTIFWTVLGLTLRKLGCVGYGLREYDLVLKVYSCLAMILYTFGFASFSNRYGLFSWLFIPFVQVVVLSQFVNFKYSIYYYCGFIFCFISAVYYSNHFFKFW